MAVAARPGAARRPRLPHARRALRRPRGGRPARARGGRRHRPAAAADRQFQLAPRRRAGAPEESGLQADRPIQSFHLTATTPNSQLPRRAVRTTGRKSVNKLVAAASTPLFERFPLGVGSWELGVDRVTVVAPSDRAAAPACPSSPETSRLSRTSRPRRVVSSSASRSTASSAWASDETTPMPRASAASRTGDSAGARSDHQGLRVAGADDLQAVDHAIVERQIEAQRPRQLAACAGRRGQHAGQEDSRGARARPASAAARSRRRSADGWS